MRRRGCEKNRLDAPIGRWPLAAWHSTRQSWWCWFSPTPTHMSPSPPQLDSAGHGNFLVGLAVVFSFFIIAVAIGLALRNVRLSLHRQQWIWSVTFVALGLAGLLAPVLGLLQAALSQSQWNGVTLVSAVGVLLTFVCSSPRCIQMEPRIMLAPVESLANGKGVEHIRGVRVAESRLRVRGHHASLRGRRPHSQACAGCVQGQAPTQTPTQTPTQAPTQAPPMSVAI